MTMGAVQSLTAKLLSKDSVRERCQEKVVREHGEQERAGEDLLSSMSSAGVWLPKDPTAIP